MKNVENLAAVEYWYNGSELQVSTIYYGKDVEAFIERHNESGTFANIYVNTIEKTKDFIDWYLGHGKYEVA
jgi:hypothetical protein